MTAPVSLPSWLDAADCSQPRAAVCCPPDMSAAYGRFAPHFSFRNYGDSCTIPQFYPAKTAFLHPPKSLILSPGPSRTRRPGSLTIRTIWRDRRLAALCHWIRFKSGRSHWAPDSWPEKAGNLRLRGKVTENKRSGFCQVPDRPR